jgi:hypothetical protein
MEAFAAGTGTVGIVRKLPDTCRFERLVLIAAPEGPLDTIIVKTMI